MIPIVKRKNLQKIANKDEKINEIKKWYQDHILEIPNDLWQVGNIPDTSEKNLCYQPPIQSKYRDRFKFDSLFFKMWPTPKELLPKFDKFYSEEEQKEIYDHLHSKFSK
jgi:hypothetical protein